MVGTRGNTDQDQNHRSFLLGRESRRASRGALEEPEDERYWDSDEVRAPKPTPSLDSNLLPPSSPPKAVSMRTTKNKGKSNPNKNQASTPKFTKHDKSGPVEDSPMSPTNQSSPDGADSSPILPPKSPINISGKGGSPLTSLKGSAGKKTAKTPVAAANATPSTSKVKFKRQVGRPSLAKNKNKIKKEILEVKEEEKELISNGVEDEEEEEEEEAEKEEQEAEEEEDKTPSDSGGDKPSSDNSNEEDAHHHNKTISDNKSEEEEEVDNDKEEIDEEDGSAEEQMSEDGGDTSGLRRSSRSSSHRRPTWLLGTRRLKGYPSPVTKEQSKRFDDSEEDEEMMYSGKGRRRHIIPRRYQDDTEEEEDMAPRGKKRGPKRHLMRNTPAKPKQPRGRRRHRDEFEDELADEQEGHTKQRMGLRGSSAIGLRAAAMGLRPRMRRRKHVDNVDDEEMSEQSEVTPRSLRTRRPTQRVDNDEEGEGGDEEDDDDDDEALQRCKDEKEAKEVSLDRHTTRKALLDMEAKEGFTEEDSEEEGEEVAPRRRQPKKRLDPVLSHEDCLEYSKAISSCGSKRMRRPVNRFSHGTDGGDNKTSPSSSSSSPTSSDDEVTEKGYVVRRSNRKRGKFQHNRETRRSLRHRRGPGFLGSPARKPGNYKRRTTHNKSSTSESNCDNDDERNFEKRRAKSNAKVRATMLPMNLNDKDIQHSVIKDRSKIGSSLADVEPMSVDRNITFSSVGGLSNHVRSLREMVVLPLLYPEVFSKFSVTPPRGVLFYGPPGTGKTLVARALANECSMGDKKVAFFMRKGADCLSKWVGESERQLRLLFDQAYQMRPSIIFFDEIDGLAPVRSSRQDQIHSSIVSTLLALMDGLDSRGEIIVIGATNRIEAIDPALRRPGRFDRELCFPLPSVKAREQILTVHTASWDPQPSPRLLRMLSELTTGYCGADIKSLCCEAVLASLRTRYPQVYQSKVKLQLDVETLQVRLVHFRQALSRIVPAGHRSHGSVGARLQPDVKPLLRRALDGVMTRVAQVFPQGLVTCQRRLVHSSVCWRPRMLLSGISGQAQSSHLGPAIVHALEKVPAHRLDLAALYSTATRTPEEAVTQIIREACSRPPSIVYMPHLDRWFESAPESVKATFLSLLDSISPSTPVLLLATTSTPLADVHHQAASLFSAYRGEVVNMTNPTSEERKEYFKPLFYTQMIKHQKPPVKRRPLPVLPVAALAGPRQLSDYELQKLVDREEVTIRELRIFLREICAKIARNRKFCMFTQPVDIEDVPDYLEFISVPMDLETVMTKIDRHEYSCAQDFLKDIDLIVSNALEYNPNHSAEDQHIRHTACSLRDVAYTLIKTEMDTDFEDECCNIRDSRQKRNSTVKDLLVPDFVYTQPLPSQQPLPVSAANNGNGSTSSSRSFTTTTPTGGKKRKKMKRNNWAKGNIMKPKKKPHLDKSLEKKEADCEEEDQDVDTAGEEHSKDDEGCEEMDESVRDVDSTSTMDMTAAERCALELCTEELSPEDSRDAVTSENVRLHDTALIEPAVATVGGDGPVQSTKASSSSAHLTQAQRRSSTASGADLQPAAAVVKTRAADDITVSSSERDEGGDGDGIVDWTHLDAAFGSCVTATADSSVCQLQQLHAVLTRLVRAHAKTRDKSALLQETEAEIRKFVQFKDRV